MMELGSVLPLANEVQCLPLARDKQLSAQHSRNKTDSNIFQPNV